jgi:outer membrane protein OmpA-like peptidoglycan-associated protein
VAYNIPGIYGLALTGEVRGLGVTESLKYSVRAGSLPAGNGNSIIANSFKLGGQAHVTALVGLRYAFNAAPPPPPPPPAPAPVAAPARSYLVFFDWDRADLTARARQVIAEAAQNSTKIQYTRIEVNGYTDTSGTPAYNQRLSVRRAEAVAAELVRDGVPRNVMDLHGFGETHLLVQTGPGVREPQNRRVEIIYH